MANPKGKKGAEHPGRDFIRLMQFIFRHYLPHMVIVVISIIISVLANVQGTMFMKTLIDQYITPMLQQTNPDFTNLSQAITRVAIFYAVGVACTFLYSRIMVNVSQGALRDFRDELFEHMEKLPIKYFDTHPHGDIMSVYTNDIDTLRQMISQSIPQILNSGITIISVLISMFILSLPLTLVTLVMVAFMVVSTKYLAGQSAKSFRAQQKDLGILDGYVEEMMEGQRVVKVFCHEDEAISDFKTLNNQLFKSADRANAFANILMPINAQIGNLSYVICAIVGGVIAIGMGETSSLITIGTLVAFLNFNKSFSMPISQVSQQLNSIVMAMAGAERIFNLMDEEIEKDKGYVTLVNVEKSHGELKETDKHTDLWAWKHEHQESGNIEYVPMKGEVVFEHVDFGYVDEKMVLHDINLYAKPGQKIAFVGATGAGKTTITNLINRFYDIQKGKIRYDGINIEKIEKPHLRKSLGIVLQDTNLFTNTVMENIRYGRLDASDEEVIAAAKRVNADGFIRHLPQGYNTMLTSDGGKLSQGQRQLLSIARAAVADPPALILDEATSSIDTRTEKIVQEGMDALMKGRTTFVIAHRLSTVKNSDCIVVLEQGRIIEKGNHEELLEAKGKYYQLYTGNAITE